MEKPSSGEALQTGPFQWSGAFPSADRAAWELRFMTEAVPGLMMEEKPGEDRFRVWACCQTREEAEELRAGFGGEVRDLAGWDWLAAERAFGRRRYLEVGGALVVALDDSEAYLAAVGERFPGRERLVVTPGRAFGTGDHGTTSACLEEVVAFGNERDEGWSLLDLGTGTGVLAMAGARFGARRVVGTEADPSALEVARDNLSRNGFAPGAVELRQEDVTERLPAESYDLVCANLYADLLLRVIPRLDQLLRVEGRACLSGILDRQERDVRRALRRQGLEERHRVLRGKWVTLAVQAADS